MRKIWFYLCHSVRIFIAMLRRKPYKLTLMVTGGCNLRCGMCDIWTQKRAYLSLDNLKSQVLRFPGRLAWINISGGEPWLNPDLADFIIWIAQNKPNSLVTVTTNGSIAYSESFLSFLSQQRQIFFYNLVSLDGPRELHDEIRGKQGSFAKAESLIEKLQQIKRINPMVDVSISFTLMEKNIEVAIDFLKQVFARGLKVNMNIQQSSAYYVKAGAPSFLGTFENRLKLESVLRDFLRMIRGFSPERVIKSIYVVLLIEKLKGRNPPLRCSSITDNLLIHSDGSVRDCTLNYRPVPVISEPWRRRVAYLRQDVRSLGCESTCLTPCEKYLHIQHLIFRPTRLLSYVYKSFYLT